jgi:MFS family permease
MAKFQFNIFGRGRPLRWAITFACQLAFVLFGYDQGVFSGIVGNVHFRETFGNPDDSLTGIIVSIYNLGCFSGCILNFFIGDYLGRRMAMWFAMCWIIVGATLQTSAFSVPHILVARFITGMIQNFDASCCGNSKG